MKKTAKKEYRVIIMDNCTDVADIYYPPSNTSGAKATFGKGGTNQPSHHKYLLQTDGQAGRQTDRRLEDGQADNFCLVVKL